MTQSPDAAAHELLVETSGPIRVLTLNRPERRNALSAALRNALSEALLSADEDDSVRVVVLTGTGEQAFCAGADLKEMRAADDSQQKFRPPMGQVERSVFEVALETKKPVIAALNGSAIAGGFELALACDLRITHPDALFGLPEAKIGMGANFSSVLKEALGAVAETARKSDAQSQALAAGKANVVDVVTAVAETEVAIEALVSVRDKVIQAYEEIMRMPI